jgi:hypothetical protein
MSPGTIGSDQDAGNAASAKATEGPGKVTPQEAPPQKLTYQVILRHLAKLRDGAHAVLDLLESQAPKAGRAEVKTQGPSPAAAPAVTPKLQPKPKFPLQVRIERHMASVDRALEQIRELNPELHKKVDLPPDVRDKIVVKERTIRDIVGAELHFWAATIENSPLDKFDEIEQKWIKRIIRLANIIGVDADHTEHLDFLTDWASREHA